MLFAYTLGIAFTGATQMLGLINLYTAVPLGVLCGTAGYFTTIWLRAHHFF
jgi:hypothetical protein